MRTRLLFLLLFVISGQTVLARQQAAAVAPDTVIEHVEVSGLYDAKLSAALRDDIQKLTGQAFSAADAASIVDRIQAELPEYVAEPNTSPGSQPDRVRLTFKVAKIANDDALGANINARYTVESVEVEGVPRSSFSDGLYAEMQQMVGQPLDNLKAGSLTSKLLVELYKPLVPGGLGFTVKRKVARGGNPQQVRIVYAAHRVTHRVDFPNPFDLLSVNYHSSMGFEWQRPLQFSYFNRWAGSFTALVENTRLDLIEHYSGIAFKYAPPPFSRLLNTSVSYASDRVRWRPQTVNAAQASATAPRMYRLRDTLGAQLDWNIPIGREPSRRWLSFSTGADFNNLEVNAPGRRFEKANAAHVSVNFSASRRPDFVSDQVTVHYDLRAGVPALGSDYSYQRQEWRLSYFLSKGKPNFVPTRTPKWSDWQNLEVSFRAGLISGSAPLFERFALGDTQTLLGWNKFDITPLGGDRFLQISGHYTRPYLDVTYYAGTVWNVGTDAMVRQSVAVGIPNRWLGCRQGPTFWATIFNPACLVQVKVAVPLRESHIKPALILEIPF